jgi:lipopolysaccharide transport system ATP-binding protein
MQRAEIEHKFDEIVAFSEVEKFIDTPMKHFSSGMQVRLAFSVAAHLDPEILLVDEVLAVGDAQFQKKCLGKMGRVVQEGRTVLFVSHDMAAIRNLCGRTLLIETGRILVDGKTDLAIATYLDRNLQEGAVAPAKQLAAKVEGVINRENPSIRLKEIALLDQRGRPRNSFRSDEDIQISVTYECITVVNDLRVVVHIEDEENTLILATENVDDVSNKEFYRQEPGLYKSVCVLPANTFGERRFYVTVHLIYPHVEHLVLGKVLSFEVEFRGYNNIQYKNRKHAWIRPQLSWLTQSLTRDHSISAE